MFNAFSLNFRRQSCPVIPTNRHHFALAHISTKADESVILRGHPKYCTCDKQFRLSTEPVSSAQISSLAGRPTSRVARRSTSPILLSRRPTACNECDVLWEAAQTIQRWKELPEPTFLILASVGLLVLQHLLTIRSTGSIWRTVEDIADDLASHSAR